jgi:molecular chaperone DnaJ
LTDHSEIKVPPGTQPGTVFRLKGKGIRNVQGYGTGDLLAKVQIEVPARLNAAQRAKLDEFAKLCDENVHPLSKSFFERAKNLFK